MIEIRYRDRGPLVAALQLLLNRYVRHRMLGVDGIFGPMTKEGVQQVQYRMRMRTSGVVNYGMWQRLNQVGNVHTIAANDIYDPRHDITLSGVRGRGWIATGGMSGGVGQVVNDLIFRVPSQASLVLLRFYGHGAPGLQGVSAGFNLAHDSQGHVICEVTVDGRKRRGHIVFAAQSPTGENVCAVEVRPGETELFERARYSTFSMDGLANQSAIAQENFNQVRSVLIRLRPLFAPFGSVEMHGCKVGRGHAGQHFLQRLARLWGVPVSGGIGGQVFGPEGARRYEGQVYTAYPNQGNLRSWTAQFR